MAIVGVGIYSIEAGRYKVFDSHARDMYHNSHSEGTCVLLEKQSMYKLQQYFQTLHRKVYILPPLKLMFSQAMLNIVVYQNVNSYPCSCKQCCPIAVYAICYSLINSCGYWT